MNQCLKNSSPVTAGLEMESYQLVTGDNPQQMEGQELVPLTKPGTECRPGDATFV